MDEIVPRAAIAQLGDASWKERKAALEAIQAAVQRQPRLKGSLTNLAPALKLRYADSNIMVRTLALDVAGRLARSMNALFEPHARTFVPPVTAVLADAKAPLRAAASATLDAFYEQLGLAPLVPGFAQVLDSKQANPTLRQDLFAWLGKTMPADGVDLAPLVPSVLLSLDDRLATVRKGAQALLPSLVRSAGYKQVVEQTQVLKEASRATAMPLIEAARAEAASGARAAPAAPAPAPARPAARPAAPRPGAHPTGTPRARAPGTPARAAGGAPAAPAPGTPAHAPPPAATPAPAAAGPARRQSAVGRSLRAPATPGMRTPRTPGARATPSEGAVPFLSGDAAHRAAREKAAARVPLVTPDGTPRAEAVDLLQTQFQSVCSAALVRLLFSQDHGAERDYLSGLALMLDFVSNPRFAQEELHLDAEQTAARTEANMDLMLRYACVRLLESHTSVTIKCFDLLDALTTSAVERGWHLSELDASSMLLCLLVRSGDAKPAFRERVRGIVRRLPLLYPPSRMLPLLMEHGATSKNARTRAESLEEVAHLLAKHGMQVCTHGKTLPALARAIGDRDAAVRSGALAALGEAYLALGEQVWRLVGTLPPRDEALLEERLKRVAGGAGAGSAARSPLKASPTVNEAPARARRSSVPAGAAALPAALAHAVSDARATDAEQAIGGLKALQETLAGGEAPVPQALVDAAADAVALQLERAAPRAPGALDARLIKHLLQTVLGMLEAARAGGGTPRVTQASIEKLLQGLLPRLMDVSTATDEAGQTLSKHLNAVILRVLAACDANDVYSACFAVLTRAVAPIEQLAGEEQERATRFAELLVKCLWKIARKLAPALRARQVDGARLLGAIEQFLQDIPPVEWGRRAQRKAPLRDIPLITATNILKQVVDALGEESLSLLDALPDPEGSHVYRYLLRLLYTESAEAPAAAGAASPAGAAGSPAASEGADAGDASGDDPLTRELRSIFDRISQKDQSRVAIRELYEFQRRHPSKQESIERSLQNTGPIFQRYIKRALANHAAEDQRSGPAQGEAPASPARRASLVPRPSSGPRASSANMDARLAELKAKFRREDAADAADAGDARGSSTDAIRQRLAAMRDAR